MALIVPPEWFRMTAEWFGTPPLLMASAVILPPPTESCSVRLPVLLMAAMP